MQPVTAAYRNYEAAVWGQRVVVVGGADPAIDEAAIDQADVVVRLSDHWLRQKGRVDVVYHRGSATCQAEELTDSPARFLLVEAESSQIRRFRHLGYDADNYLEFTALGRDPGSWWYRRLLGLHPVPTIGLIAAYHLLQLPTESVTLTGMDLWATMDWNINVRAHDPHAHAHLLQRLAREDSRLCFSRSLEQAIEKLVYEDQEHRY